MPASTGVHGRKLTSQRGVMPAHCARVLVALASCRAAPSASVLRTSVSSAIDAALHAACTTAPCAAMRRNGSGLHVRKVECLQCLRSRRGGRDAKCHDHVRSRRGHDKANLARSCGFLRYVGAPSASTEADAMMLAEPAAWASAAPAFQAGGNRLRGRSSFDRAASGEHPLAADGARENVFAICRQWQFRAGSCLTSRGKTSS